jgi:formylglycine-generating enzyme required for sulfatase activity
VEAEGRAVANLREAENQRAEADRQRLEAESQRTEAENQRAEAEFQRGAARENELRAVRNAELAATEADNARQAEAEALRQKDMAQLARDEAIRAQLATEQARQAENDANQRTIAALRQQEEEEKLRRQAQEEARRRTEEAARLGVLTDASLWAIDPARAALRQEDGARAAGRPAALDVPLGREERLSFRWLPVGEIVNGNTFVMGSPPEEPGRAADEFLHPVTLTRPIYLAATELTRGQWKAILGDESAEDLEAGRLLVQSGTDEWRASWQWRLRPLPPEERELPATGISFLDVQERLLPALAALAPAGHAFRLPSEAEWECAARAGTITPFASGADSREVTTMGWVMANSGDRPHPVGSLKPNAWGFYDMHGNASEMTADLYDRDFYLAGGLLPNPVNDGGGKRRVARGGAYVLNRNYARSAARAECHEANRFDLLGARLALEPIGP